MTFSQLYENLLKKELLGKDFDIRNIDKKGLNCLLEPENYAAVIKTDTCKADECDGSCKAACIFNAIDIENGNIVIKKDLCCGCAACIKACKDKKIVPSKEIVAAIKAVHKNKLSYALVAPAFMGQFDKNVTPGMLRNALKKLGFTGMVEVSLFADILTLKEALELNKNIKSDTDFMLTSCCCPVWISMIKRNYDKIGSHLYGSVSPMIACGRLIKKIHPSATTVFIGPCLAKKSEAKEKDLLGAIDYCVTFKEIADAFNIANIDPRLCKDSEKDHSSKMGRIYAVSGGVSEAVITTAKRLSTKDRKIKAITAEGVKNLKDLIDDILNGNIKANFYEGMGCDGGCVGGPKAIIKKEDGKKNAADYAAAANYETPIDNPFCIELLERIGVKTVEDLLDNELLKRDFI